jgi:hypothetical protein
MVISTLNLSLRLVGAESPATRHEVHIVLWMIIWIKNLYFSFTGDSSHQRIPFFAPSSRVDASRKSTYWFAKDSSANTIWQLVSASKAKYNRQKRAYDAWTFAVSALKHAFIRICLLFSVSFIHLRS